MRNSDVTEPTNTAEGECCTPSKDVDKVINVILSEFEGDTSAFFESIRLKQDTVWRMKSIHEAAAVRKFADAPRG